MLRLHSADGKQDFMVFRLKMALEGLIQLNFNELGDFYGINHRNLYKGVEVQ